MPLLAVIQSMNTKFNKEELKESENAPIAQKYVKDDFFDTMSCEALEKASTNNMQKDRRGLYADQRKLDMGKAPND